MDQAKDETPAEEKAEHGQPAAPPEPGEKDLTPEAFAERVNELAHEAAERVQRFAAAVEKQIDDVAHKARIHPIVERFLGKVSTKTPFYTHEPLTAEKLKVREVMIQRGEEKVAQAELLRHHENQGREQVEMAAYGILRVEYHGKLIAREVNLDGRLAAAKTILEVFSNDDPGFAVYRLAEVAGKLASDHHEDEYADTIAARAVAEINGLVEQSINWEKEKRDEIFSNFRAAGHVYLADAFKIGESTQREVVNLIKSANRVAAETDPLAGSFNSIILETAIDEGEVPAQLRLAAVRGLAEIARDRQEPSIEDATDFARVAQTSLRKNSPVHEQITQLAFLAANETMERYLANPPAEKKWSDAGRIEELDTELKAAAFVGHQRNEELIGKLLTNLEKLQTPIARDSN